MERGRIGENKSFREGRGRMVENRVKESYILKYYWRFSLKNLRMVIINMNWIFIVL